MSRNRKQFDALTESGVGIYLGEGGGLPAMTLAPTRKEVVILGSQNKRGARTNS